MHRYFTFMEGREMKTRRRLRLMPEPSLLPMSRAARLSATRPWTRCRLCGLLLCFRGAALGGADAPHLAAFASDFGVEIGASLTLDGFAALLADRLVEGVAVSALDSLAAFATRFASGAGPRSEAAAAIVVVGAAMRLSDAPRPFGTGFGSWFSHGYFPPKCAGENLRDG
jgi:hypothetical protein